MRREDLLLESDSLRIAISLAKDRGPSTAALVNKLSEIDGQLSVAGAVEPMAYAVHRKRRQRKAAS